MHWGVVTAAPVGKDLVRCVLASVLFGNHRDIKFPDRAYVKAIVILKDLLEVGQLKWKHMLTGKIRTGLHDFAAGMGRILEGRGESFLFALGTYQLRLELDAVAIRKSQRLFQENRGILVLHRVRSSRPHIFTQHVYHVW